MIVRLHKRNRSREICISSGLFHRTFTLHSSGIQIVTYYWGLNANFLNQNEKELNPSLLIRDCSFYVNMSGKFHFFCWGLPPQICIKCIIFPSGKSCIFWWLSCMAFPGPLISSLLHNLVPCPLNSRHAHLELYLFCFSSCSYQFDVRINDL